MAFTAVVDYGSSQSKTAGTALTFNTNNGSVGNLAVVVIASDNVATTTGASTLVSSVADNAGNSYAKADEYTYPSATPAAGNGATISVWYKVLTAATTQTNVLTVTFASSVTAKAAISYLYSIGAGSTVSVQSQTQNTVSAGAPGSLSLSGLPSGEYLFVRGVAQENTGTGVTGTSLWTVWPANTTAGSTAATNMRVAAEHRVLTGTTATSNPTLNTTGDSTSVLIAFKETAGAVVNGTATPTGTAASSGLGDEVAAGAATVNATGHAAAATLGDETSAGDAVVAPLGQAASSALGAATAAAASVVNGTANPAGLAAVSAAGSPTVFGAANVSAPGQSAAASAGTSAIQADASIGASGATAISSVGSATAQGTAQAAVSGQAATTAAGTATAAGQLSITGQAAPIGQAASAVEGAPEGRGDAIAASAGVIAGASLGTPQRAAAAAATPAGVAALLSLGSAIADGQIFIDAAASPTGLLMTAALGWIGETVVFADAPAGSGWHARPAGFVRFTDPAQTRPQRMPQMRPDEPGRHLPADAVRKR